MLRLCRLIVWSIFGFITLFSLISTANAHGDYQIGEYLVVIGWEKEPVIVGERNAIILQVSRNGVAVTGLEGSLEVEISYGGALFLGNMQPTGTVGHYLIPIYPTVRGQYSVRLTGKIGELEIDQELQPEEVLSASTLQFPEILPEPTQLQEQLEILQAELRTVRLLGIAGTLLGIIGTALGVFSFLHRSSSQTKP